MATGGLIVAAVLAIAGSLLLWAHAFVDDNVHTQLAEQNIEFPAAGSPALTGNPEVERYVTPYAGQQVVDGEQAASSPTTTSRCTCRRSPAAAPTARSAPSSCR